MVEEKTLILVVDDDPGHLVALKTIIRSWGYEVLAVDDGSVAVAEVRKRAFDLILMDVRMTVMGGMEALKNIKAYNPAIPILIMTAYSSVESAVEALKLGAYDYLTKPLDFEVLKLSIERAREHLTLKVENRSLKEKLRNGSRADEIVGTSEGMRELMEMASMVAPSDATVLITGESGTGKELIARAIHHNSRRNKAPFVIVNCGAISEPLLESELFGHEKGAFTGAERRHHGRFEQADGGTIFLDEVGEMSKGMQSKLLRVIQERELQRVGGGNIISVDVRILSATNRDLKADAEEGSFREDLYYRLNVVTLNMPPLRERAEDIPLLAQHFLGIYAEKNRKTVKGFSPQAMDMLLKYSWPGNIRELENAVERAVILLSGDYISERELPMAISRADLDGIGGERQGDEGETRPLMEIEKEVILKALAASGGNKSETARRLGINRKTLHKKLKNYGVG